MVIGGGPKVRSIRGNTTPFGKPGVSLVRIMRQGISGPRNGGVNIMPVNKVKGGYRWGAKGRVYKKKSDALRQAKAAYASGYKRTPKRRGK